MAAQASPDLACNICTTLGRCYYNMGQYGKAIALFEEDKKIVEEVGRACGNLGSCYESKRCNEQYMKA